MEMITQGYEHLLDQSQEEQAINSQDNNSRAIEQITLEGEDFVSAC